MATHTCAPGHAGALADGCERCDEHAADILGLDASKTETLWDKMVAVEYRDDGGYATDNERRACRELYNLARWLERYMGVNAWVPFAQLRGHLVVLP